MNLKNLALITGITVTGLAAISTITPANAAVFTFQQGVNGYTGARDAELREADPNTNSGGATSISIDADEPPNSGNDTQGLIGFDNVFGNGPGQIPLGYKIVSATLTLNVFNRGSGIRFVRILNNWDENTVTWNSFGADGITPNSAEATPVFTTIGANDSNPNIPVGVLTVDISGALAFGGANNGLGLLPFVNGTNGIDFYSAQYSILNLRPLLTVTAIPVPEASPIAGILLLAAFPLVHGIRRRK